MPNRGVVDIDQDSTHDLKQQRLPRVTEMEKYKDQPYERNKQGTQAPQEARLECADENPDVPNHK
jgi:hypothetical protein